MADGVLSGERHRIGDALKLFGNLDRYEGYSAEGCFAEGCYREGTAGPVYRHELREVTATAGRRLPAWIYWYNPCVDNLPQTRSGDYLTREPMGAR